MPDPKLAAEIARRIADGCEHLTVAAMGARFRALGYVLDRSLDCRSNARYMTGDLAGVTYPCCSTGLREIDSGLSFANFEARRDEKFRAMMKLRQEIFAVSRGHILEV